MKYLKEVYKHHDVVKIDGIELILCNPEFSSFNKEVRDKLYELEVTYAESN